VDDVVLVVAGIDPPPVVDWGRLIADIVGVDDGDPDGEEDVDATTVVVAIDDDDDGGGVEVDDADVAGRDVFNPRTGLDIELIGTEVGLGKVVEEGRPGTDVPAEGGGGNIDEVVEGGTVIGGRVGIRAGFALIADRDGIRFKEAAVVEGEDEAEGDDDDVVEGGTVVVAAAAAAAVVIKETGVGVDPDVVGASELLLLLELEDCGLIE